MLAVAVFNFPYRAVRDLTVILVLTAVLVGAMVVTAVVVTAVTPVVVGCCVAAAPVVGQVALAVALIGVYAWWFKP
jgi:hypothetical protein